jgi:hypothetical protein
MTDLCDCHAVCAKCGLCKPRSVSVTAAEVAAAATAKAADALTLALERAFVSPNELDSNLEAVKAGR